MRVQLTTDAFGPRGLTGTVLRVRGEMDAADDDGNIPLMYAIRLDQTGQVAHAVYADEFKPV